MAGADDDGTPPAPDGPPPLVATRRRSPKQSELIARDLATYIVDADLPPGTPLPPEREMVESLGVGRTTLREALRLLETRGVLTIRSGPRGGPIVRRPDPRDLSEGLSLILEFDKADLTVMMEARSALEPAAARLAATHITPEQLDGLKANNQTIRDSVHDVEAFFELNKEFHRLVAEASGNIVVRIFVESIMSIADGQAAGIVYGKPQIEAIAEAHDRVINALEAGDPKAAEAAMNEHLEDSHKYWRRKYNQLLGQSVSWAHS
jgi:GntR family transcriptional repressor for pyruvate dehydrogenase complex